MAPDAAIISELIDWHIGQQSDCTLDTAVQLLQGCTNTIIDVVTVSRDVLTHRRVDDILFRHAQEVGRMGDELIGFDVNLDGRRCSRHGEAPSTRREYRSTKVPGRPD
jgi:hypothetical protein